MRLYSIILAGFIMVIFMTCNKQENTQFDYNKGIEASQSFVEAEQMMVQLLNTYFKSITDSILISDGKSKIDGADVLYYSTPEEKIVIKYPTWGANDGYGHWRTNTYEAVPNPSFNDPNAEIEITFNDFFFDKDTIVVSNMRISQLGKVDGENEHYNISADRVNRIYSDTTGLLSFNFDQQFIRYKDPSSVYTVPGDKLVISGELVGVTKSAMSFSTNIEADLSIETDFSCNWLKAGPSNVAAENFNALSYVYFPEPDSCINQYVIIIDDNPFPYPID